MMLEHISMGEVNGDHSYLDGVVAAKQHSMEIL